MITKIKKAIVGALLNSDTFKSTLEKIVSDEVQCCVDHNDDLVTDESLDRALNNLGYDYEIPDRDEVREIVYQEIEEGDIDEKIEDATQYYCEADTIQDMIQEALIAKDIRVCSDEELRDACLRTLANLIESAE